MFPFQGVLINKKPGFHVGGGNFVSKLNGPLICTGGMDQVYKLRLNIDADQYAEHFVEIDEWLQKSISHTPFIPFQNKPELVVPLITSYKFYYGVGTKDHPRLNLERFEGKAQFTLWLPPLLIHDLSCLEDRIEACVEASEKYRLERFQAKTEKDTTIAEQRIKRSEKQLDELKALHRCFLEAPDQDIHLLYWQSLATWIRDFESTLEEKGILSGGIDNADLTISHFFSLRRTAFTWNFRENGYIAATEEKAIEELKKTLHDDPIYHLLLENLDPNHRTESTKKYQFC